MTVSHYAIQAEAISKRYQIGHRAAYGSLRDALSRVLTAPRRWVRDPAHEVTPPASADLWALDRVSFDVRHGDVIGLIGRNGSGKSTLLKILSRVTEPTSGRALVQGRVGSLLEVGTGFHPELTGRENVYVNGAILGMKQADIRRQFDAIVDFAGVARFIDSPVKHYSSGMQMRLAFAVAAHLEPTILLVDEVLAVGDLEFQKKCLGKMESVSSQGRTVLFVSHQMNQMRRLCSTCVWLEAGRVRAMGPTADLVNRYEAALMAPAADAPSAPGGPATFRGWDLDQGEGASHILTTTGPVAVSFSLDVRQRLRNAHHGIALHDQEGRLLWGAGQDNLQLEPGHHTIAYTFDSLPLRPGPYRWYVTVFEDQVLLDSSHCTPEMLVATMPTGHRRDECAGFLNMPYGFEIAAAAEHEPEPVLAGQG